MNETIRAVKLKEKEIVLVGTAHISQESISEVKSVIEREKPDRVCIEIDGGRYATMTEKRSWENLDIVKVLKEGKGFLLLANLALSSFQRRLGAEIGINPGDEMKAAVEEATARGIPYSFCDREVQITLKRAWGKSNLWNRSKLLASLLSSTIANEKLSAKEIENLKEKSALDDMMGELASYLPSVKSVLIDERDRFLATKIWESQGSKIVAVVGAGHLNGIVARLKELDEGILDPDLSDISGTPLPSRLSKAANWILPSIIVLLLAAGFFKAGAGVSLSMLVRWMLLNGSLAAIGSVIALAHPLSILVSFIGAPIATLNPFIGVGMFSGIVEAFIRKPQVQDFENLSNDIMSLKGFYRNKITRILLVFFLSSLGGMIGNFISIPYLTALVF